MVREKKNIWYVANNQWKSLLVLWKIINLLDSLICWILHNDIHIYEIFDIRKYYILIKQNIHATHYYFHRINNIYLNLFWDEFEVTTLHTFAMYLVKVQHPIQCVNGFKISAVRKDLEGSTMKHIFFCSVNWTAKTWSKSYHKRIVCCCYCCK